MRVVEVMANFMDKRSQRPSRFIVIVPEVWTSFYGLAAMSATTHKRVVYHYLSSPGRNMPHGIPH